jgi:prephenate dehydrogenase
VAVPPVVAAEVIVSSLRRYLDATVSDVASTKTRLQREVESLTPESGRFVPGHPLAGREVSGPAAARADLFADRVWALTPSSGTEPRRTAQVAALIESLGAVVVTTTPEEHDRAVALTSHTPQVVSSLVAAGLDSLGTAEVRLSGQGLRDMTRLAGSDPDLWTEILTSNAEPVSAAIDALIGRLVVVRDGLRGERDGPASVHAALSAGVRGVAKVPGKHGTEPVPYAVVPVVIEDRPGELGRLFASATRTGVNLEDVRIDHAQGRPTGLVELEVRPGSAAVLAEGLREDGFEVRD